MSDPEALAAVNKFVDSASQDTDDAMSLLDQVGSALGNAVSQLADSFSNITFTTDPFFSGVVAPDQIAVLMANLNAVAAQLLSGSITVDTGNKINQLFGQTQQAVFSLSEVTPDYFYSQMSGNSTSFQTAITQALADVASLAAAAASYNAFIQTMSRTDLDGLNPTKAAAVRTAATNALAAINAMIAEAQSTGGIRSTTMTATITAMMGVCTLFTDVGATIAYLWSKQVIALAQTVEADVNAVLSSITAFTSSFTATLDAPTLDPIVNTINAVAVAFANAAQQLTSVVAAADFDQFSALGLWVQLCQSADVSAQLFTNTPETIKTSITASPHFPTFTGAIASITGFGTAPATTFLADSALWRQSAQAVLVSDIRSLLATRTTTLLSDLTALAAWLTGIQGILTALPVIQNALADAASALVATPALSQVTEYVANNDMTSLAEADANTASLAGSAAQALSDVIDNLPPSQLGEFDALCNLRNMIVAVETTQIIASDVIMNETPSAVADVNTLSEELQQIQQQAEALLS